MNAVAYLFHPRHAQGEREFLLTVRQDGREHELTLWARSTFEAIDKALDEYGPDCHINARPL